MYSRPVIDQIRSLLVELSRRDAGLWRGVLDPPVSTVLAQPTGTMDYRLLATAMRWIGNEADNPLISTSYMAGSFYDAWSDQMDELLASNPPPMAAIIPFYLIRRYATEPNGRSRVRARLQHEHQVWRERPCWLTEADLSP